MLAAVTGKSGTAKKANTQYYQVAGKTGTSHKVGKGGYQSGSYMAFFAGYAPRDNPRIVTVVVIDDPKGREYYGGEVAAPVFSKIVADSLRVLGVMPDKMNKLAVNHVAFMGAL
jgi:cell division protein FtsI (penicillin-binding protein 3)